MFRNLFLPETPYSDGLFHWIWMKKNSFNCSVSELFNTNNKSVITSNFVLCRNMKCLLFRGGVAFWNPRSDFCPKNLLSRRTPLFWTIEDFSGSNFSVFLFDSYCWMVWIHKGVLCRSSELYGRWICARPGTNFLCLFCYPTSSFSMILYLHS